MFLREAWYVAATLEELSKGPIRREILGEMVMIYRGTDHAARAIGDLCPHRFASLSQGKIDGDFVTCPYHGLQFR